MIEVILYHDDVKLICKCLVNSVKNCKACAKLKTVNGKTIKIIYKTKKKKTDVINF